jgi:hypothetical protein
MSALKTIGTFFTWLLAALLCASAVRIYVFQRFDEALGSQFDNLWFNVLFDVPIALVITSGFAAVVLGRRRRNRLPIPRVSLPLASVIACGLIYAFTFTGLWLSARFESWQLNLTLFAAYSIIVGALTAAVLVRLAKGAEHAA